MGGCVRRDVMIVWDGRGWMLWLAWGGVGEVDAPDRIRGSGEENPVGAGPGGFWLGALSYVDECEEIMAMHAKTARYGRLCVRLGDL